MNKSKLNFLEFETLKHNKYIFDNNTGVVIPSSEEIEYIIKNFDKTESEILKGLQKNFDLNEDESKPLYNYINILVNQGMFISNNLPVILNKKLSYEDILNTSASQLFLILTEACNLRCKYCVYSEYYPGLKGYSDKEMSVDTAIKAVDKYMEIHNQKVERGLYTSPKISFYGGEPFLKFDIIKTVVNYCKQKNYNVSFFATTNGTILNDDMVNFVIDNNINLAFSLDGNKENHDRNRVSINNKPTFDVVLNNIEKLQSRKQELNVDIPITFSVTFDLNTDMERVIQFFDENGAMFSPYSVTYNKVGNYGTTYYDGYDLSNNLLNTSFSKLHKKFFSEILKENTRFFTPAIKSLYKSLCFVSYNSKFINLNRKEMCIPGSKMAVAPDGKIYMCEKVNQACSIGDLTSGISVDKINEIANKYYKIINKNCANCRVSRLCDICYSHLIKDDDLCFSKEAYNSAAQSIKNALSNYYSLLETNSKKVKEIFEV